MSHADPPVIEWDSSSHVEGYNMWLEAVLADGGEDCRRLCELANEPLVKGMLVGLPENILTHMERREVSSKPPKKKNNNKKNINHLKFEDRKTAYQRAYLKRWIDSGIDAIITPVLPWVAFKPKTWVESKQIVAYTAIWNLLNWTSLTIPAGVAEPALDQPDEEWKSHIPRNETDKYNHEQCKCCLLEESYYEARR
jgi:amidase